MHLSSYQREYDSCDTEDCKEDETYMQACHELGVIFRSYFDRADNYGKDQHRNPHR